MTCDALLTFATELYCLDLGQVKLTEVQHTQLTKPLLRLLSSMVPFQLFAHTSSVLFCMNSISGIGTWEVHMQSPPLDWIETSCTM